MYNSDILIVIQTNGDVPQSVMADSLDHIIKHFEFEGSIDFARPFGNGHINDTFEVSMQRLNGAAPRYILQRINHHVFKDPVSVMANIERVTMRLKDRITARGGNPAREVLTIIPTLSGSSLHISDQEEYWRAYAFIENTTSYDRVEHYDQVRQAARAFGEFQNLVGECDPAAFNITIPNFHNTVQRFANLVSAVEHDDFNRASRAIPEIEFALAREDKTGLLLGLHQQGLLPERVTHNDTKLNNVLLDNHDGRAVCVIDLDTVMPGLSLYDFGDAIRSMANTGAEDQPVLSDEVFDLKVFETFADGYLSTAGTSLNQTEIDNLAFSAILISLESGMRFLTDYLEGDHYYKVSREDHNLQRCRTQFRLVAEMEARYPEMVDIIERYTRRNGLG